MSGALVAFATRNGSTQAVAEVVAATMRAAGETVELRPAREVRRPLGECHLVVLGAPIYSGRWHGDAHRFLKRHRRELGRVPVAVFAMGPRSATEEGWRRSREQLDRAFGKARVVCAEGRGPLWGRRPTIQTATGTARPSRLGRHPLVGGGTSR